MQPSTETLGSLVLDRSNDDYGRKSGLSVTMGGSLLNVDYEYDSATWRSSSAKIDDTHAFHYSHRWGLDLSGTLEGAGGVGGLLAIGKKTGTAIDVTCFYDGNGNVTQLLDLADGSVEAKYEYDPFGKEIVATGNLADWNKYRFSTKYLEDEVLDASEGSELDLYYYGYRYYSPRLGRWITRDPIGERGGINIYSLGMNNPYTFLDYLGLDTRLIQDLIQAKKVRLDHNDIRKIEEIIPDWIGRTWLGIPDWYHVFAMKDALPAKWRCINKWLKKNERNLWDATVGREPVSLTIQSAVVATINGVTVYSYTINIPLGLVLSGVSAYLDVKTGNDVLRLIDNIDLQVYLSLIYSHMKSSSSALEAFERISGVEQGTVTDDEIKELIPWWRLILEWKEIHGFFPQ